MSALVQWARRSSMHRPLPWSLAAVALQVAWIAGVMAAGTPG